MTTRTELLEIISNGENSGVEFKRDDLQPHSLAKELVAFSNLDGGRVLLGVEDDGTVSGIVRQDPEEWVMNVCRDKIRPPILPFFEIVRYVEGENDVAIVRVSRGYSVHAMWHNDTNRYLIRVGTKSRDASQEEIARLFQRRGSVRAELMPLSGARIKDLDLRRLRYYFRVIRQQVVPDDDAWDAWKTLLINTEIMTEEGVTVLGMLLFGRNLAHFLPHAAVDAVAYPGAVKDYNALERCTLRGPMTPLLDMGGDIIENGLVEQVLHFARRNIPRTTILEGGRRVERPVYPDDVIRECIVNALIHRDYLLAGTDIELAIYSNRLEVVSPGRPPNGITPVRMRAGTRAARNQMLKDVMRDYSYLEHMGMGIPRKILQGMRDHNNTEPELIDEHERFTVRLIA